jgi:hypothetical protein
MKKKPSYLEVLPTALALIMVWMMIGLVLYWLAYAPPAFSGVLQNAAIDEALAPGQPLLVQRKFCLNYDVTLRVHREFQDGVVFGLPDIMTTMQRGCHDMTVEIDVPHSLPPGAYLYRVTVEYDATPLRRHVVQFPDVHFVLADQSGDAPDQATRLTLGY